MMCRNPFLRVLRTPLGATAGLLITTVLLTAILAPVLWGTNADVIDTNNLLAGPSAAHPIGTDNLGRDLLFRVLVASRLSIELALVATLISVSIGLVLGAAPILLGRALGKAVTWFVGIAVAFPGLLLALFFAVIFGVGELGAVLAIGFAGAPSFARLCQTLIGGVAGRDYVAAAQVGGIGRVRVLVRHILPNIAEPLVINATIGAGGALLAFAGLSFLGLGVQAPAYDWGRLMMDGLSGIYVHPLAALGPGAAVVIAGLAFNLVGEATAKALGVQHIGPLSSLSLRARAALPRPALPEPRNQTRPHGDEMVLEVEELRVTFPGPTGLVRAVRGVTFALSRGEAVGVVGESGSGKSLTALAIAQLVEEPGRVRATALNFLGKGVLDGGAVTHRRLLGTSFSLVFQDPMSSFNPTQRIGRQLAEVARFHQGMTRRASLTRAIDRLHAVRIVDPERRAHQYPHEFSGGMLQRAMIGMGLMGSPKLIIADEPTTALDVTVQRQVLDLLQSIQKSDDVALLLISHDVSVVAEICDRVLVMYAGRIIEDLPAADLTSGARHPYTRALVAAVPDMQSDVSQPLTTVPGRPVDPANVPSGCAYAARCPLADAHCRAVDPDLVEDASGRRVACWHPGDPIPLSVVRTSQIGGKR
ncbi:dipeptide/oligopeptide/nickel ABC transporter permease/ATP-binding protein [Lacisediminihabitans sp. FW035]